MAGTNLVNIIIPEQFSEYTVLPTPNARRVVTSPVVANMQLANLAEGGNSVTVRYFNEPSSDDEVMVGGTDLTDTPITSSSEFAIIRERAKSFAVFDIAKYNAGADPVGQLESFIRDTYWVDRYSADLKSVLTGVARSSAFSFLVNDVTGNVNSGFNVENWLETRKIMGDQYLKFTHLVVHSDTYTVMEANNEITFERASEGAPFGVWRGLTLLVDDAVAPTWVVSATANFNAYATFAFAPESVIVNVHPDGVNGMVMTEVEREGKSSLSRLITRRRYFMHLKGTKWVGTPAANSPTNDEIATTTNWQNSYPLARQYPYVICVHKN